MKFSLKKKLITSFTIITIMTGLITTVIGTILINNWVINQVQDKVRNDLNSAREISNNRIETIKNAIYFATLRNIVKEAVKKKDRRLMKKSLMQLIDACYMEIAVLTDKNGVVLFRLRNPEIFGDTQANDQLINKVLLDRKAVSSPVIIKGDELYKEGEEFANRAHIKFIPTPKAKKIGKTEETSGMFLKAAAPIHDQDGNFIGILYGGDIINRNYSLVDKIKNTVYQAERYNNMDMGTATIFQGDLRISTNVITNNGNRAIGTRVSEEVYDKILRGEQWIKRAFVVNAWYITAYEPIRDIDKRIIGILYVGMLEQKFMDMKRETLLILFTVTIIGMILVLLVSNFLANRITKPINYLVKVSRQISNGDFSIKVNVDTSDELGELEKAFNTMASRLHERDEELKIQTQRQLMRSEKLAALGRMAAGIAHEINNPLTGVLMYGHLLLKKLPEESQNRNDAEIIVNETSRCRDLVRHLLDFSRENIPEKKPGNINDAINATISIIKKQIYFEKLDIIKILSEEAPEIMIDINQIEQVLLNLTLNAAEAMSEGGKLIIQSQFDRDMNNIVIKVSDTGSGISEDNIDKIFDPFFTTKEVGKGTGLGLAVSYGIIQRHDGQINVESHVGKGTTFTITLPVETSGIIENGGNQ